MKYRLIVIANIGFILGIIVGLYFKKSIILFLSIFVVLVLIFTNNNIEKIIYKLKNKNRHFKHFERAYKYLKKYLNLKLVLTLIIFFIISFSYSIYKEEKFNQFVQNMISLESSKNIYGIVISEKQEKEYTDSYKVKILNIDGKNLSDTYCFLKIKKQKNKQIKYGDLLKFSADFTAPKDRTNYKRFSYKEYLKTINVSGIFKTTYSQIKVLGENQCNYIYTLVNNVRNSVLRPNR